MILTIDVGNSQIHCGLFVDDKFRFQFRMNTQPVKSSDEYGVFFRSVLQANEIDPGRVNRVAICSVVPETLHSLRNASRKYFGCEAFILKVGSKTGLKIRYKNPQEVGADRIANAIAATELYPQKNVIVIDMGTATTFDVISADKEYLGGTIIPGLKVSMLALAGNTAKLPSIELVRPKQVLGRSTNESLQNGLYWGHLGALRELVRNLKQECFQSTTTEVIATGGFAKLFDEQDIYKEEVPNLVHQGLFYALRLNSD